MHFAVFLLGLLVLIPQSQGDVAAHIHCGQISEINSVDRVLVVHLENPAESPWLRVTRHCPFQAISCCLLVISIEKLESGCSR
ncbi:hypothetical protein Y032_0008g261 [Ancylostoma ceylanicum]|uniref:Secreted protein n=1 Tax=Ancylostoma ceylanicum TaxID=53326 RepID=A0A016VME5_9BILA|nr:hypothetical protein Y032_0008g261 [Ancylostoma ceylanicum]